MPSSKELENVALKQFNQQFAMVFGNANLASYINDIKSTADVLLMGLGVAFGIGLIYLIVLRLCGGPIIYISLLLMIAGCGGGGYMLFQQFQILPADHQYKKYYEIGSYVVWGIGGLLLLCILCNCKNIRIGVKVMKCTAQFIGNTPQVFLIPFIFSAVLLGWLFVFIIISLFIVSIGEMGQNENFKFITEVKMPVEAKYLFLYNVFGYLWMNAFIIGIAQFVISAAAALWYFSSTSDSAGSGSLLRGFWWVFRYHLGSIAFGSFLIALIQFIRIIFEYYKSKIEKFNKNNPAIKVILCLTSCCLDCLERFIKFITKNAYIQMAITGKNFCSSAWNGFLLVLKNALRFGTANFIGFIFNVIGVLFIGALNGCFVFAMLHYVPPYIGLA